MARETHNTRMFPSERTNRYTHSIGWPYRPPAPYLSMAFRFRSMYFSFSSAARRRSYASAFWRCDFSCFWATELPVLPIAWSQVFENVFFASLMGCSTVSDTEDEEEEEAAPASALKFHGAALGGDVGGSQRTLPEDDDAEAAD